MPTEDNSTQAPKIEDYVERFQKKTWELLGYHEGEADPAVKWLERITDPKVTLEEAQALMSEAFGNGRERHASIIRFLMAVIQHPTDDVVNFEHAHRITTIRGAVVEAFLKGGLNIGYLSSEDIEPELDLSIVQFLRAQELEDPDERVFDYVSTLLEFEPRDFEHTTDEQKAEDLKRYSCITAMIPDLLALVERCDGPSHVNIWPDPDPIKGCTEAEIERKLAVVHALEKLALGENETDRSKVASAKVLEEHPWAAQQLILYHAQHARFLKELLDACAKELPGVAQLDLKAGKPLSEIITEMQLDGKVIDIKALEAELAAVPTFR